MVGSMSGQRGRRERAVLYLRQSTFREESISLELQETAAREHAEREGYDVVAVEADPGISGRTFDRPAVKRAMAAVADGAADVIVLWKWSRLSRSRKDWAVAADAVEQRGGRIESATEAIDTSTSTGRLARGVMVEFAAFESERIGDVWRETHARRLAEGKPINGKARFGYTYDRDQKLHIPDPVAGPVLAEAYRRYIAGESFYALNAWIRETGVPPAAGYGPQARPWHARTLRRVLDSGFGAGLLLVDGEHRPGAHDPVITEGEWLQYRARRAERAARPRTERSQYLLSGLIRCGTCGGPMQYSARPAKESGPQIRCREAVEGRGHERGITLAVHAENAVLEWLDAADAGDAPLDITPEAPAAGTLPGLERERDKTYEALTRLAMQLAEEAITPEVHARAAARYEERLAGLEADIDSARAVAASPQPTPGKVLELVRAWPYLGVAERRADLREHLDHVAVTPGGRYGTVQVTVVPRAGEPRSFTYQSRS